MTAPDESRRRLSATYRLQLGSGVTFDAVRALVPYFARLGVSHLYLSPVLKARAGSAHGYDIVDHTQLNPEIGDGDAFDRLVEALHGARMGVILDIVPNHMGIGGADNGWWLSVLEWGEASAYAGAFDIDWHPADPALRGKVLLPYLGDHYGRVLEGGELVLRFDRDDGSFSVWYYEHRLPIAVRDYPRILARARARSGAQGEVLAPFLSGFAGMGRRPRSPARQATMRVAADSLRAELAALAARAPEVLDAIEAAVAEINGTPGRPDSFRDLHALLERQAYRVAFWGVASDRINYRRFFDINDLAGLRVEQPEVFDLVHQLIFRLLGEGKLDGLRIDHIDGLYDPADYCRRLQERAAYLMLQSPQALPAPPGDDQPLHVWVEKILGGHERLRDDWPVAGTTGYEVLALIGGLFVDPAAEAAMGRLYRAFTGRGDSFDDVAVAAKRQITEQNLASELSVLVSDLHDLAQQSWSTRDLTYNGIRDALIAVVAHFPVYRTYVGPRRCDDVDRHFLDWAFGRARKRARLAEPSFFDFLYLALSGDAARARPSPYRRRDVVRVAMKFQQFTGPVMAKAVEDTALYRFHRLVALNEVGGEPDRFGVSAAAFHHLNLDRLRRHPASMTTTATHDTKRGEDTRARLAVLSEMPRAWASAVRRWAQLNRSRKRFVDDAREPGRDVEYLLYQTLVGAWPPDLDPGDRDGLAAFAERIVAYMTKAVREAKERTSWLRPDPDYEAAVEAFTRAVLDPVHNPGFVAELAAFVARIAPAGAVNGLAQALLRVTVPGVPDTYQGNELWDHNLVDPDNRRPVDFAARRRWLDRLAAGDGEPASLAETWRDGTIKLFVLWKALALRRARPQLFAAGDYVPLEADGPRAAHLVAFLRRDPSATVLVAAPRLCLGLLAAGDAPRIADDAFAETHLKVPDLAPGHRLRSALDGTAVLIDRRRQVAAAPLFRALPVALLVGA